MTYDPSLPSTALLDTSVSAARLTETDAALSATGSLTLYDADTTNVVTAAVDSVVVSGVYTGLTLTNAQVKALFSVVSTDTNALQVAKINWTFNSASEAFNWLAEGEELILTYQVSANDNAGGTDTSTVTITVVGTNDAPVLTPGVVTGTVVSGAPVAGSVAFTDVDQSNTVAARVLNDSAVWSGGSLTDAQKTALYAGFSITPTTFGNTGTVGWTYTTPAGATTFLRAGQTITLKEYIEVKDSSNKAVSQLVTVTIQADSVAPTVTSVSVPTNGTYVAGQNLDFTVNFSEAVTVTGLPRIALTVGSSTLYASYLSGSGGAALVFRLAIQSGNLDTDGITVGALALNSGTIKDASGNAATLTLNSVGSTAAVRVDAVTPAAPS